MQNASSGDPQVDDLPEARQSKPRPLATAFESPIPEPINLCAEFYEPIDITGNGKVIQMPLNYSAQPAAKLSNGRMAVAHQRFLHCLQLCGQTLGHCETLDDKLSSPALAPAL